MGTLRIGTNGYTYELIQNWARLPAGWQAGEVSAVAVDSQDRVYMFQRGEHPLVVFDREGNFLRSWGEGIISDPHGICISPADEVYLVDRDAHQVLKITPEGGLLLVLGEKDHPASEMPFNHPADISVAPTGELYICDGYANSRVHRFSAAGKYLGSWGAPGSGSGEFRVPHSIWVDRASRVYVADRENDRVQIFGPDGSFITEWKDFYRPTDIYVDANEVVYIIDHIPRLSIFDQQGNLLARGRMNGNAPHGIWGDSRGDLYVANVPERRLDKYVRTV